MTETKHDQIYAVAARIEAIGYLIERHEGDLSEHFVSPLGEVIRTLARQVDDCGGAVELLEREMAKGAASDGKA